MAPTESIAFLRPAGLAGIEALHAAGCTRAWHLFHETFVFVSGQAGASQWRYRGGDHVQGPRGVMLIEPGEFHRDTRVLEPTTFQVLFVDAARMAQAAAEAGLGAVAHLRRAQTADPALWGALTQLHRAIAAGTDPLEMQAHVVDALARVLVAHAERPLRPAAARDRPAAGRARAYLQAHWDQPITLDALAAASLQSKFHLLRAFREAFGLPPHAYQMQLRIARARALLARGEPIAQVALAAGFADQSHFTLHFRRALGVTPGTYRSAR